MPIAAKFALPHWMRANETYKSSTLTESNVTALSLAEIQSFSSKPVASIINTDIVLGYGTHRGSQLLRERIAETLCSPITSWGYDGTSTSPVTRQAEEVGSTTVSPPISADNVLVTIGTSSANLLVLDYLVGPGDHVICQYPTYSALFEIPRRAGAQVSLWRSKEKNMWIPDPEELKDLVRPNTKLLVLNNPNNPTGAITPLSTLKAIASFCQTHSLILFCDEIFRPLFHSPSTTTGPESRQPPPPSALLLGYPSTIVTGSLSKAYSLPGLRIGWIATPMSESLLDFMGAADYTTIAVSALDDQVAAFALQRDVRAKILARSLAICKENLALWDAFVEGFKGRVEWIRPTGAGTGWLRVRGIGEGAGWVDDQAFASELVRKTGLLVVPGAHCFSDPDGGDAVEGAFMGYVRVALGNKPEKTKSALELFGRYLEESE